MTIKPALRISSLSAYAFAAVEEQVNKLRDQGIDPIDFGVGDPTDPTPELIRRACAKGLDDHATSGYPSYIGGLEYRTAVAEWTARRFDVALDPQTEICASIGSKEAVFNLANGFVDPGDLVLVTSPGYPPATRGTLFAGGEVHVLPLTPENQFLPDLDAIPAEIAARAKMLWINYPNNPTGKVAPPAFFEKAVAFCREHDILLASDEAYTEIYFGETPPSALQFGREGVLVFQSLSKRSSMTGYRIGWVAGDEALVSVFKKVKTNIDSGTPTFIQQAAIAALADEQHVVEARGRYQAKRDLMVRALADAGLPECRPDATLYIWQRTPEGMTSTDLALRLLDPSVAVVATPGEWISAPGPDGKNPGEGFVRFALVPNIEDCQRAAERIAAALS